MKPVNIYILTILVYGVLDIILQKNSKSIVVSKSRDRTYLPVILTFILNLTVLPFEAKMFHKSISPLMIFTGVVLCVAATIIRTKGQLDLKKGFSTRIEVQNDHKLINTGLYSMIRHPLYLAILVLLLGANIMLKAWFSWIFMLLNSLALYVRIDKEEQYLRENLPGYREYMKNTWRLIPGVY